MRIYRIEQIQLNLMKSNPPQLGVFVQGQVTSSGWTNPRLVPLESDLAEDGILDLEFLADPPTGISMPVLTSVAADFVWDKEADRVLGARVVARTNEMTSLLNERPPMTTEAFGEETGFPDFGGGLMTTFALGEETGGLGGGSTGPNLEEVKVLGREKLPFTEMQKGAVGEKTGDGESLNDRLVTITRRRNPFGQF